MRDVGDDLPSHGSARERLATSCGALVGCDLFRNGNEHAGLRMRVGCWLIGSKIRSASGSPSPAAASAMGRRASRVVDVAAERLT